MRTVKFRGKKYTNNKWCYGTPLIQEDDSIYLIDIVRKHGYHTTLIVTETLGEFTGQLDVDSKEIYEGDVVKVLDNYDKYGKTAGEVYEVIFANGGFRLKSKYSGLGFYLEDGKDFEVIGDIYSPKEDEQDAKTS